jgi:uncharacterized protein YukE
MSMPLPLALTPQEAAAHIQQVEAARDQAVARLRQLQDTQANMLSSGWQGSSATTYGKTSDQQADELEQMIKKLTDIVDLSNQNMHEVSSNG